jgi:hypothetical protein
MPPKVGEYCDYFASGYFGYTFDKSEGNATEFPCPAAAEVGSNSNKPESGDWFCTINKQSSGGGFPKGAKADCSKLASDGVFGYSWDVAGAR